MREASFLPSLRSQNDLIARAGCDATRVISGTELVAHRRVLRAIAGLKAGDELVVVNLSVVSRRPGSVAEMVRNLLELGVTLRLAGGSDAEAVISPDGPSLDALAHIAEAERLIQRDVRPGHPGGSKRPLSKYQIEYARRLHTAGESLRAIGLLFQLPPAEIWDLINEPIEEPADADDAERPLNVLPIRR